MKIWVDADSCPLVIKEILFRAAVRVGVLLTLVANKTMPVPPSPYIRAIRVPAGFNVADSRIADELQNGDLVITDDIPLAAEVIKKGGHALNCRGEFFTRDTIRERLTMRNLMAELRSSGVITGGPSSLAHSDRQAFANQLDRFLTRHTIA